MHYKVTSQALCTPCRECSVGYHNPCPMCDRHPSLPDDESRRAKSLLKLILKLSDTDAADTDITNAANAYLNAREIPKNGSAVLKRRLRRIYATTTTTDENEIFEGFDAFNIS